MADALHRSGHAAELQAGQIRARALSPTAIVLLAGLLLTACGGGEEPKKPPMPLPSSSIKAEAPAGAEDADWTTLGENPKWKPIAAQFEAYTKREAVAISNPMLSNITDFLQRPVIEAPQGGTDQASCDPATDPNCAQAAAKKDCDPKTDPDCEEVPPLLRDPVTRYQLIMLVTGLPVPKAVVLDSLGEQYDLVRGDALGSEGGRVTAILQYKMLISVPGKPKPIELSIAPPLTRVEEKAEKQQNGEL